MDNFCDSAGLMAPGNGFQLYGGRFYSHLAAYRTGRSRISVNQWTQSVVRHLEALGLCAS